MPQQYCLKLFTAQLIAATILFSSMAQAIDEANVTLIYKTVRTKHPDLVAYCKLTDAERRQIVVSTTMQLAGEKNLPDPFAAGAEAGSRLRQECGLNTMTQTDLSKLRWTTSAKPLVFDVKRGDINSETTALSLSNRIYAPTGSGSFPAVVINHTKGGVSHHILLHAKELINAGFAVMVVDSFVPRGIKPGGDLFPAEFAKDAYDALTFLQGQTYIDKNRIFHTGYSYGALAAALLSSPQGAEMFKASGRFRATVANYGTCAIQGNGSANSLDMLSSDSDRPLLMLMAEKDIELPTKNCFPLLEEMKAKGKDVSWHIYPNATHAWDKEENSGHLYRANNGETMTYRYDPAITKDSTARMIEFFNRYR